MTFGCINHVGLRVVKHLDERKDICLCFVTRILYPALNALALPHLEEDFRHRTIMANGAMAHAELKRLLYQERAPEREGW